MDVVAVIAALPSVNCGPTPHSLGTLTSRKPARILLVAAMNPCLCGFYGDSTRECRCTPGIIQRYLAKVSGPLLDRIDLHIEVPAVAYKELRRRLVLRRPRFGRGWRGRGRCSGIEDLPFADSTRPAPDDLRNWPGAWINLNGVKASRTEK
jgi:hypothetical protein